MIIMPTLLGLFAIPFALALGLLVGLAIAGFQLWATRRAAERATAKQSPLPVLLGMPLRVGVSALAFVLVLKVGWLAFLAALVAFQVSRRLLLPYFEREAT